MTVEKRRYSPKIALFWILGCKMMMLGSCVIVLCPSYAVNSRCFDLLATGIAHAKQLLVVNL